MEKVHYALGAFVRCKAGEQVRKMLILFPRLHSPMEKKECYAAYLTVMEEEKLVDIPRITSKKYF